MIVANMASFPSRENNTLQQAVSSISRQVNIVNLCLNEFEEVPAWVLEFENVNAFIPEKDYKDVGKFVNLPDTNDDVLYVDDDILYPRDYVSYLKSIAESFKELTPIVGVHGTIYSDVFDGNPSARTIYSFRTRLRNTRVVNQLGTGTVYCKGWQSPSLEYMAGSEKYVDVRFARHAQVNGWPLLCAAREATWMGDLEAGQSIYESFTKRWPITVIREAQAIAGYGMLPTDAVSAVECS